MLTAPHAALVCTELSILPRRCFIYIAWRRLSLYIKGFKKRRFVKTFFSLFVYARARRRAAILKRSASVGFCVPPPPMDNQRHQTQRHQTQTPDSETPDSETPDLETPDLETTVSETPDSETPDSDTRLRHQT
ncbi:unnamed protein product [Arctogadus glacialis]